MIEVYGAGSVLGPGVDTDVALREEVEDGASLRLKLLKHLAYDLYRGMLDNPSNLLIQIIHIVKVHILLDIMKVKDEVISEVRYLRLTLCKIGIFHLTYILNRQM